MNWRIRPHTVRLAGETVGEYANRVPAKVAERLIGAANLAFADHLERAE